MGPAAGQGRQIRLELKPAAENNTAGHLFLDFSFFFARTRPRLVTRPVVMAEPTTAAPAAPINWDDSLAAHSGWLRSVVAARLGEPQAVDDVMQDVAAAAVASATKAPLSDPVKIAPWLYRIAVRQALLYRRSCGRRRKLVQRFAEREGPTETDHRTADPLDWMLSHERAARFRDAMDELSDRDREVLMLKYEHGWSYQQISDHLGISLVAVETRLHRARKRLRAKLANRDIHFPQRKTNSSPVNP